MKNIKSMSNAQFVKHIMESGSPINQLFVIECLEKYSKHILDNQDTLREKMKDHIIHPNAWIASAMHVQNHILNRFA